MLTICSICWVQVKSTLGGLEQREWEWTANETTVCFLPFSLSFFLSHEQNLWGHYECACSVNSAQLISLSSTVRSGKGGLSGSAHTAQETNCSPNSHSSSTRTYTLKTFNRPQHLKHISFCKIVNSAQEDIFNMNRNWNLVTRLNDKNQCTGPSNKQTYRNKFTLTRGFKPTRKNIFSHFH